MGLANLLTRTCTIGMLIPSLLFSSSCSDSSPTEPPKKEQPAPKPVNNCPVFISSSSSKSIDENKYFSEQIQARDSDGDPIYYSLPVNPGWLSVSNTGLVSGLAPEVIQDQTQQYEVMITDGKPGCAAKQQNTVTVKNVRNNYVVSNNLLSSLQNVNDNNLVFSSSQNFSIGDVLVSGVNNKAPFGFLREITSMSSDGKTFGTKQGSLEQVLTNTSISFNKTLSPSSISHSSELEGITFSPMQASGFEWGVNLNNVVLYDRDGNPNTAHDQIIANGKILFNLKSEFDAKFGLNKLERLAFKTTVGKESDITIGSNLYGFAQMRSISLMENYMTPITIVAAGIPVVIVPKLSFNIGLNPTQSNLLSLRVKQNSNLDVGFKYETGIEEIGVFSTDFDFSVGSFREDAGISAFAGPRLDLLLYGVGGPVAALNSNLKMEFEKEKWKLYGGLRALAGASMEVFGKGISAFARQVIEYEKLIAESSTQPPTQTRTDTITLGPNIGKDAFVRWSSFPGSSIPKTNYNNDTLRVTRDDGWKAEEILVQFPLNSIPSGASIDSAKLSLYGYCGSNFNIQTVTSDIRKIIGGWVENAVTWDSKPNYSTSTYSSLNSPAIGGTKKRHETDITNLVKEWYVDGSQNHGAVMIMKDNTAACIFNSKEHPDQNTRPMLMVSYKTY